MSLCTLYRSSLVLLSIGPFVGCSNKFIRGVFMYLQTDSVIPWLLSILIKMTFRNSCLQEWTCHMQLVILSITTVYGEESTPMETTWPCFSLTNKRRVKPIKSVCVFVKVVHLASRRDCSWGQHIPGKILLHYFILLKEIIQSHRFLQE